MWVAPAISGMVTFTMMTAANHLELFGLLFNFHFNIYLKPFSSFLLFGIIFCLDWICSQYSFKNFCGKFREIFEWIELKRDYCFADIFCIMHYLIWSCPGNLLLLMENVCRLNSKKVKINCGCKKEETLNVSFFHTFFFFVL